MNDPSNVRRIPPQPTGPTPGASFADAVTTMGDALGRATYGSEWPEVRARQRRKAAMEKRREKITSTMGYVLAVSLMFWLVIVGWAAMVVLIRAVTP